MISVGHLLLTRAEAGQSETSSFIADFLKMTPTMFDEWWSELSPYCPCRLADSEPRISKNALRIEYVGPFTHCSLRDPDGRGLAWIQSGGSVLAYGSCCRSDCPLLQNQK